MVNAELRGWRRWMIAATTWHPDGRRWRQRFTLGDAAAARKARLAALSLGERRVRYDAVVQAGATFDLPRAAIGSAVRVVYSDANIRFAARGQPYSGASSLDAAAIERIARRERRIYDRVDRIWTWSDALRQSYIDDFGQAPSKVTTIYAGANVVPAGAPPPRPVPDSPPLILFVGKDHARKGSATLLDAFARVRTAIPGAELHLVGGIPENADVPGVTAHGVLDTSRPEVRDRLRSLYDRATVFCLPSRYEPFGVVFIEAMLAGLPCIGSDRWAMPEIIEHGVTGWLAPDGNAEALAALLERTLRDPVAAAEMGRRGRERALERFTWDRVAERALNDLAARQPPNNATRREVIA